MGYEYVTYNNNNNNNKNHTNLNIIIKKNREQIKIQKHEKITKKDMKKGKPKKNRDSYCQSITNVRGKEQIRLSLFVIISH